MNPVVSGKISNAITKMTKADAMAPIVGLESMVIVGRTYQAKKRGGRDEARERCIEESLGSITWLAGVGTVNKIGDKIVSKILKKPNAKFDVGTDKLLRTPFENFMRNVAPKGFSPKQVALIKATKVGLSIIITNLFIGFAVPKLNHKITNLSHQKNNNNEVKNSNKQLAFKGHGLDAINIFTNAIENTNTGKLLSSDVGITGGRAYNARKKEERTEVLVRDGGSIYFYMWAPSHINKLMNYVESGNYRRLNPATAQILDSYLQKLVQNKNMSVKDFRTTVLGKNIQLPEDMKFETEKLSKWDKFINKKPLEVIKLSDAEKFAPDNNILSRLQEMSKLQPKRLGESVLTKQQVLDSFNIAEINNPKLLDKAFTEFSGGVNKEEYKYISNKSLYKLKTEMEQYVENICKSSKDGKVNKKLLDKALSNNLKYSGINFMVGFGIAAAFLSTYIPKLQYYITKKTTGVDAFPGTYDYEYNKKNMNKVV